MTGVQAEFTVECGVGVQSWNAAFSIHTPKQFVIHPPGAESRLKDPDL